MPLDRISWPSSDMRKTVAIDFDGVIHRYSKGWQDGVIYDEPMPGAIDALFKLHKHYNLVIFTCREDSAAVSQWLIQQMREQRGCYFDIPVTNVKPIAMIYIDDRGLRFTNWTDVLNYLY